MAKVSVFAAAENDAAALRIQERLQQAQSAISERAYHRSLEQNGSGSEQDDWLRAERDLYWIPDCELVEQNGNLRLRVALPGMESKQIQVTSLPGQIVVESTGNTANSRNDAEVVFTEFTPNAVLRSVALPAWIDVGSVKAKLERGILEVSAIKQAPARKRAPKQVLTAQRSGNSAEPKPARRTARKATTKSTPKPAKKTS